MGFKKTKALHRVLGLFKNKEAIAVLDVIRCVKNEMNKSTVYRILERLENEGFIYSFINNRGLMHYVKCAECHSLESKDVYPHFECKDCGRVERVDVDMIIPDLKDKRIHSANVHFTGLCQDCM